MMTALLAAATTVFATCALPEGDIKQPATWGQYFLDKFEAERIEAMDIEPADRAPLAQPRTVLLITGVTIPAEWFDPIKARLERDGFRPVVYEPPDLLSGDLFWNSEELGRVIDTIRAETGEARIDILAECTGGLIARHYMQALGGDQHVRRMVTFISPQHGLPKAAEASLFVDWDAVRDLTPGSEFLETVNSAPLPTTPITSIYTCTDEYIQPYETSIIPGAKNIGIGCEPGEFVGHYQFFYDREIYKLMRGELLEPAPSDLLDPTSDDPAGPAHDEPTVTDDELGGCSSSTGSASGAVLFVVGLLAFRRRARA